MPVKAATHTAASSSEADVQAKMDIASNGDTILIPAGTSTWTSVALTKGLRLVGAAGWTTGVTKLQQSGSTRLISVANISQPRVLTGITFDESGQNISTSPMIAIDGGNWRFSSNIVNLATGTEGNAIAVWDSDMSGLIRSCTVTHSGSDNSHFALFYADFDHYGSNVWNAGPTWGTTNKTYVENCTVTYDSLSDGVFDGFGGSKFAIRYNTFTNAYFGWHGVDSGGGYRSSHSQEIYGNNWIWNNDGYYAIFNSRGGTMLCFSNTTTGTRTGGNAIQLQYFRLTGSYAPWGQMTGSNGWDGNEDGTGYPGLDQQGMTGPATYNHPTVTTQTHSPTYIWSNTGAWTVGADSCIQTNRDYYGTALGGYTPLTYPHPMTYLAEFGESAPSSGSSTPKAAVSGRVTTAGNMSFP